MSDHVVRTDVAIEALHEYTGKSAASKRARILKKQNEGYQVVIFADPIFSAFDIYQSRIIEYKR